MMDPAVKSKEMLRLLWEVEDVLPEVLQVTAGLEADTPGRPDRPDRPDQSVQIRALRRRLETLLARARALREATDCLPAADAGRAPS